MRYDFGDGRGLVEARLHENGGGVVEITAEVEPSVYVDRECVVFGFAQLRDRVRVLGRCRISGSRLPGGVSTLLEDDAIVAGNVVIEGQVLMRDKSQARGCAKLSGQVAVMHSAVVCDNARVAGNVRLRDHSYLHEDVTVIAEGDRLELMYRDLLGGDRIYRSQPDILTAVGREQKRRKYQRRRSLAAQANGATMQPAEVAASAPSDVLDMHAIVAGMVATEAQGMRRARRVAVA